MLERFLSDENLAWEEAYAWEKLMSLNPDGTLGNSLAVCYYLREADHKKDLARLEEKYGIEYTLGFFGFTYVTGIQYIALDEEEGLPDHLKGKGITIVRVTYEEVK